LEELKARIYAAEGTRSFHSREAFAFERNLRNTAETIAFICEVKKASPSKGIIAQEFPYLKIAKVYEEAGLEYKIEITKAPGHGAEIARLASEKGLCRVYSVGGDGTVNEIVNGIAGSTSSLAVIPGGSGNDFVRSIGFRPGRRPLTLRDREDILKRTIDGTERTIDLASVNGRYFINIASVGFDAQVLKNTLKLKGKPGVSGSMAYVLGIFTTISDCKNYEFVLDIDGREIRRTSLLTAVANGRYYGGGMQPAPEAVIDDGRLDICLVGRQTRLRILRLFPKYMKGRHGSIKGVEFFTGSRITITSDSSLPLNIDGEVLETNRAEFEIFPGAIRVVFPQTN
jgi:YegS/Rv2252/BmrU family lipid kinase